MKVRRKDHWKPQSPVREGGVVYRLSGVRVVTNHLEHGIPVLEQPTVNE
jgi:hypothetical protein